MANPNLYSHVKFPDYTFVEYPKWVKNEEGENVLVHSRGEEDEVVGTTEETDEDAAPETEVTPRPRGRRRQAG